MVALLAKRPSTEKATWTTKFEFCPCHVSELSKCFNIRNGSWHDHAWTKTIFSKKIDPTLPDPTAGTGGNGNRSNALVPSLLVTTPIRRIPGDIKMASPTPTVQISPKESEPFDIEFPPIKRPCCWSLKLITWDTYCLKCLWSPLVFSGVQGHRDKKGIYTTWIALSWTENFEQFLMQ